MKNIEIDTSLLIFMVGFVVMLAIIAFSPNTDKDTQDNHSKCNCNCNIEK